MLFLVFCVNDRLSTQFPRAAIGRPCATGSPRRGGRKGGALQRDRRDPFGLGMRRVAPNRSPNRKAASSATIGSQSRPLQTKMRQGSGEVSEHRSGFTSDQRWLDMTPKTRKRDRYELGLPVLLVRLRIQGVVANSELKTRAQRQTNNQNDALRQRGPPGPLARTHRG